MSKVSYLFVAALFMFSFMTVQSLIPVFANSSQATIIGGATNGNIFGSVQLDELNFTSIVAIRSNGDDGPVWLTVTYPTGLGWNATFAHTNINIDSGTIGPVTVTGIIDGGGFAFNNLGDAGNDLGAANTLVGTTFSGVVDGGSNNFNNLGAAGNDLGAANTLVGTTFSGNPILSGGSTAMDFNNRQAINVADITFQDGAQLRPALVTAGFSYGFYARDVDGGAFRNFLTLTNNNDPDITIGSTVAATTNNIQGTWNTTSFLINPVTNNTDAVGADDFRFANIFSVVNTAKSQVTGDLNFEGGGLDWTLIESSILGDKYKGLVLIDKPTIIDGKWVFPENYRRIFEVNEQGVFHLGNQLAFNNQISDLQSQINALKQEIESLREGN